MDVLQGLEEISMPQKTEENPKTAINPADVKTTDPLHLIDVDDFNWRWSTREGDCRTRCRNNIEADFDVLINWP